MRRQVIYVFFVFALSSIFLLTGCKKREPRTYSGGSTPSSTDRDRGTPTGPAPTLTLEASPTSIARGEQSTLSWTSTNASSVVFDNDVGNVSESGSVVVSPRESATYTAIARGPGGDARASARITVVDRADTTGIRDTPVDEEELARRIQSGQVKPVYFDYDQAQLSAQAIQTLKANALHFRELSRARVIIEGHCDERGTEEYNLALGDRRALAVKEYLIQLGIEAGRMETVSFGEEQPASMGHDEAAYRLNRRAEFKAR